MLVFESQMPKSTNTPSVAVIIPCYRVADKVVGVVERIPPIVTHIFCVDDACPEQSGKTIEKRSDDPRVKLVYHETNRGVGGSVKTGYQAAREAGCDIAVKIDGDGQMDPALIPAFLHPILTGDSDYTKGNRFFRIEDVRSMPRARLIGNAILSFLTKLSSGYWNIFDPTNGYTAVHLSVLDLLALDKIDDRYFFETDMLFRLNVARCSVRDIPMTAQYGNEKSGLKLPRIILPFLLGHVRNFFKRVFYSYFLRDFNVASLQLLFGPSLLLGGSVFGGYHWWLSADQNIPATSGTVMIAAVSILTGLQLALSALNYDMANIPRTAMHSLIGKSEKR